MKALISSIFAAALLTAGAAHAADAYDVEGSHAFAVFKVDHLGIAPAYGQFMKLSGALSFDADATKNTLSVEIDANSVFTGNKKRDDHLKGPDFFDTKQFPKLTFTSTSWKKTADKTFEVTGNLTIRGQTKPITVTVKQTGMGPDPWGNQRLGLTSEFKINRLDYGVAYMPEGLGKEVTLMLSIEFVKKK